MRDRLTRMAAVAVLVVGAAAGSAGCASTTTDTAVSSIDAAELVEVAGEPDVVVLDVRTPEEYAAGHVTGAVNIDVSSPTFVDEVQQLPQDVPYVVYCRSGNRSAQAAAQMADLGFSEVYDVDAGLTTLAEAGVPLTQ